MLFEYPSKDDWNELISSIPYEKLAVSIGDFKKKGDSLNDFVGNLQIETWLEHLGHRLFDVQKSYVMLMYYYEKGIPDDEWFISPGKRGESIEYFPHFEKRHHLIKRQFDYYVDVFYYKIFSAWDNIGHVLNLAYDLGIKRVSFKCVVPKLKTSNAGLHGRLHSILEDDNFTKASDLRNTVTHNYLPSQVGSAVTRRGDTVFFGAGDYIPSKVIKDNAAETVNLLVKTLDYIKG
ncbi:MAG: hypothetical protein AMJ41_00915 [candidate division Zixibacteria bacterium DG_27]|nr:MAG: hypothetical protein AMJ41_00915 [candidate division Zixibacteria bacterium DG_27]